MATGCARPNTRQDVLLVRDGRAEDIQAVIQQIASPDADELCASTGFDPYQSLCYCYSKSAETWAVEADGEVIALGGVSPSDDEPSAAVWLICGPGADRTPKALLRLLRKRLLVLKQRYGLLFGFVDDRNKKRKRWLHLLGFNMTNDIAVQKNVKLSFRLFVSRPSRS